MNSPSKQLIRWALVASVIAFIAGCIQIQVSVNDRKHPPGSDGGKNPEPSPNGDDGPVVNGPPTGNAGGLYVPTSSFQSGNNGQTCFPASKGWDKFYIVVTNFLGSNTPPDAMSFTNIGNLPKVRVTTCNPTNGTTLETGVVIFELFHPDTDKKCVTNSPSCLDSSKLTINARNMASGKKYRAVVHYKSSTLGSLTNVVVQFNYQ
jgi:hypothetical protein